MTVDLLQNNVDAPIETGFPPLETLFAGTSVIDYDVLHVLESHHATTTLCIRQKTTGELAELRMISKPFASTNSNTIYSKTITPASNETQTTKETPSDAETLRYWNQNVAAWMQALRLLQKMGPNPLVQRLLNFGEVETGFYVLLEHVEGTTLRQMLETGGARTLPWTLALCAQIASTLDFAAHHNLFYGDLTPDNLVFYEKSSEAADANTELSGFASGGSANRMDDVLLSRSNTVSPVKVKLRNFGLSCLSPKRVSAYIAPEQIAGQMGDARSDIYMLGALAYTCLSGRPPFAAQSREELCRKIQTTSPLPLLGQPTWARDIIARAMQRAPADRYRVAVDIVTDLTFQRSPAVLELNASLDSHEHDCSLGHFVPALALKEIDAGDTQTSADANELNSKDAEDPLWLTRALTALRNPFAFMRRPGVDPNAEITSESDGLPIHGFLGRFNSYMALQEYVVLDQNDSSWRGWRGLLRCIGIRLPAPSIALPAAAPKLRRFHLRLPRWLTKRLKPLWRVARFAVPFMLLAMCLHAGQRVQQHGKAWVLHIAGHAAVLRDNKKTVALQSGDTLDALDAPVISTDKNSRVALDLVDSHLEIEPNSSLRITQMGYYNGARQRRMELLNGEMQAEIGMNTEHDMEGHYEITCNDVIVQTLPSETSTILALEWRQDGAVVRVIQGRARVTAHGNQKQVEKGGMLDARIDKQMLLSSLSSQDMKKLVVQFPMPPAETQSSLMPNWLGLYTEIQDKTLMPFADQTMGLLNKLPGSQSALNDAQTFLTASRTLKAISDYLGNNEMPAALDLHLKDIAGISENERQLWLKQLADRSLVAYQRLDNGSCVLLAREKNAKQTLLKCQNGQVMVVDEAHETAEINRIRTK